MQRRGAAGVDPYDKAAEAPSELVSFTGSFHGRTLGALVLTYKVRASGCAVRGKPWAPAGFIYIFMYILYIYKRSISSHLSSNLGCGKKFFFPVRKNSFLTAWNVAVWRVSSGATPQLQGADCCRTVNFEHRFGARRSCFRPAGSATEQVPSRFGSPGAV